jgi:hypothetical protein
MIINSCISINNNVYKSFIIKIQISYLVSAFQKLQLYMFLYVQYKRMLLGSNKIEKRIKKDNVMKNHIDISHIILNKL